MRAAVVDGVKWMVGLVLLGVLAGFLLTRRPNGPRDLRQFQPDRLATLELDMWQAYYRHERIRLVRGLVTTLREQYHCSYVDALRVGYRFGRAASIFSDLHERYEQVMPDLQQGYAIVRHCASGTFDPAAVAERELAWWVARRIPDQLAPENVGRLIAEENALIFGVDPARVLDASLLRARAGRLCDDGGEQADWRAVSDLLHQSYRALHVAVQER